ncbi:MAG: hypothetical protein N3D11_16750, partial [Candidatus Sumerlaeia bacterium]|nr:hypothetical protein [Candidatus Sumerlaeia bacterium]
MLKTTKRSRREHLSRQTQALHYLHRLIMSFSRPADVLAAYLRRPMRGFSFRAGIEHLMRKGLANANGPDAPHNGELVRRARAVLDWLDGTGNG